MSGQRDLTNGRFCDRKWIRGWAAVIAAPLLVACGAEDAGGGAQGGMSMDPGVRSTVYRNGTLLTMTGDQPTTAEALVERDGRIVFVGDLAGARRQAGAGAMDFDLEGATLMPGFIEPHLHPSLAAVMLRNEIIAPYDWRLPSGIRRGVSGESAYRERLARVIGESASPDEVYFVWGYHQLWHGELSRDVLNAIAPGQAVAVIHRSFHEIFLNDAAIARLGIREAEFADNAQVDWARGHFYEGGWLALVPVIAPVLLQPEKYRAGLAMMSALLKQNGITTIAEPGFPTSSFEAELALLRAEMAQAPPYDVYLIPNGTQLYAMQGSNEAALAFIERLASEPQVDSTNVHFLPRQVKLFADGAIYSQLMQMKEGYTDGHEGEWMTPPDLFREQVDLYWRAGFKLHVHANGDLGQQMVIDQVARLQTEAPRPDHRFTLHHMGYFGADMADQMARLGMEASVNPYYLWALADKYAEHGLGPARAANLAAIGLLVERDIPVSFHSDFSMAPVEPLTLAWTAVNRVTSSGRRVSQDQRITVHDALRAITVDAARTLDLESELGTLAAGKVANFTLLGANPLEVDPMQLRDIAILGVVYRGVFHGNDVDRQAGADASGARSDVGGTAALQQRVAALEEALGLANRDMALAEAALAQSEREVTELEALVDEIKARGENPADHAELALEKFRPAFFRYQDAAAAYDTADALRRETEAALERARADLEARREASAGGGR